MTIVETKDSGKRKINPVAMTIFSARKEYGPSRGSKQRPPVLKSATLTTKLWGSAYTPTKATYIALTFSVCPSASLAVRQSVHSFRVNATHPHLSTDLDNIFAVFLIM